jgi:redox-sensitive bicupin YhaK (pirin superfamily)
MITLRRHNERGKTSTDWLQSMHTFSFGHYYDKRYTGFGDLRVINEDIVAPSRGFSRHSHSNMEIITFVLTGTLAHQDSLGTGSNINAGDVQVMSAGTGIEHSEFNHSSIEPVHFLQIWIHPERLDVSPRYQQKHLPISERLNQWQLLVSPDQEQGSLHIYQNAKIQAIKLADHQINQSLDTNRKYWIHLATGSATLNGIAMLAGDGAALIAESSVELLSTRSADILLFDLA